MSVTLVYFVGVILMLVFASFGWIRETPEYRAPIPGVLLAALLWPAVAIYWIYMLVTGQW